MRTTIEKLGMHISLHSPWFFKNFVRKELYRRYKDPEAVHEHALQMLSKYSNVIDAHNSCFDFPELAVDVKGIRMQPFGTAAGLDKNADAIIPLSYIFGFLTKGTFVIDRRDGNDRPRVAVDVKNKNAYNAQGFPSMGEDHALKNLNKYQSSEAPKKPIIANICGLPYVIKEEGKNSFAPNKNRVIIESTANIIRYKEFADIPDTEIENALENAYNDAEVLVHDFNPYAAGFEYNPFSPNTKSLSMLRRPDIFEKYARMIRKYIKNKLLQVKMGPYEPEGRQEWLRLVEGWMKGGGDGVTAVNTYMVQKENVPAEKWGYATAGKSGRFLRKYRRRAVRDTREAFPETIIFATGGISDGRDAYETFLQGADAIEGYTPYTFYGLGLAQKMMKGVSKYIKKDGYKNLQELINSRH